ncbi:NUDIX hydrolase [Paenibacillaceae bacterium WGS1546]|uniref:NUDIX hydrolase n=1 Tax=Cohnella sp. WGS1546 TaxID=3366810 RepID=UPI00372D13C6
MNPPKHIVSAAAIVLNDKNEILLIKGPRRGWEMPGGQVEEGESLSNAAIRETKEESGIDIEIIGGELIQTAESLESGFFPIKEALEKVEWKDFRQRIEYCLRPEIQPFCIEFNDKKNI